MTSTSTPTNSQAIEAAIEQALSGQDAGVAGQDVMTGDERAYVRAALVELSTYVHTPGGTPSRPPMIVKMSTWV